MGALFFVFVYSCRKDEVPDDLPESANSSTSSFRESLEELSTVLPYTDSLAMLFAYEYYREWALENPNRVEYGVPYFDEMLTYYNDSKISNESQNFLPLIDINEDTVISILYLDFRPDSGKWILFQKKDLMEWGDNNVFANDGLGIDSITGTEVASLFDCLDLVIQDNEANIVSPSGGIGLRGGENPITWIKDQWKRWWARHHSNTGCADNFGDTHSWWDRFSWNTRFNFHFGGSGSGKSPYTFGGETWSNLLNWHVIKVPKISKRTTRDKLLVELLTALWRCEGIELDDDGKSKTDDGYEMPLKEFCLQWSKYYKRCLSKYEGFVRLSPIFGQEFKV